MRDFISRNGGPLPEPSAGSYCTYVSQAEDHLGYDLDLMNPREPALVTIISALRTAARSRRTPAGTLNNCQSGVRAYAKFLTHETK
jgi:hypothetical protein